jgi:hypothetical protein
MVWIVIAIAVVAAAIGLAVFRNVRRGRELRRQFGPEYARVVAEQGNRESAELELELRRKRRRKLEIHPLPDAARERYLEWLREIDGRVATDPGRALAETDALILEILHARGYPAESFGQAIADISVDDPDAAQEYRAARALLDHDVPGGPTATQLATAFAHYRELIQHLLAAPSPRPEG